MEEYYRKKIDALVEIRKQDNSGEVFDSLGHILIIILLYHVFNNHTAAYLLLGIYILGTFIHAYKKNQMDESINSYFERYQTAMYNRIDATTPKPYTP